MLTFMTTRSLGSVAAVAATALALTIVAPAPATAAPGADAGLFGAADPTYDGVYRQSQAILGLVAASSPVPASAVSWLIAQQCPNGSFQAYRADVRQPCDAPDPSAFTGPDSNSTALAATALRALGRQGPAARATTVLLAAQNTDGGWGYTLGSPSDVNSTGLTLAALRGAPRSRAVDSAVSRAMRHLRTVQAPCTGSPATRFGLPYQAGQPVNALASVQALVGMTGTLPARPVALTSVRGTSCGDPLIEQVSSYVDRQIRANAGAIPSALGDGTDWNATAGAVIGLAAAGAAPSGIATAIRALGRNVTAFVGTGTTASPAAAGTLIQAAVAAGARPRSFGPARSNLITLLLRTLRA